MIKFANYLLTRKHVQSVKDTATLLIALDQLGNNPVSYILFVLGHVHSSTTMLVLLIIVEMPQLASTFKYIAQKFW